MSGQHNLRLWEEHIRAEFVTKNVHDALATIVEDASVLTIPTGWAARARQPCSHCIATNSCPRSPTTMRASSLIVTDDRIVEETLGRFHHTKRMDWFLPGLEPTGKPIEVQSITVIEFRDGKMAAERLYWDMATALRQIGGL